jgi:hypothetical protein
MRIFTQGLSERCLADHDLAFAADAALYISVFVCVRGAGTYTPHWPRKNTLDLAKASCERIE